MAKPLTGYGYGSIWFPNDATLWIQQSLTDFTWVVYHAHNGFLQVASEIGLPLSCIALLMVAQQLIEIFYCQYERQQVGVLFVLAFVVAYLISNFSEARFLVNRELYWIFFLALPISMLRQINLKSIDVADGEADDKYSAGSAGMHNHTDFPVGKPWLRPMAQKDAALIGSAGVAATDGLDADIGDDTLANRTNDQTTKLLPSSSYDETDIDLGEVDNTANRCADTSDFDQTDKRESAGESARGSARESARESALDSTQNEHIDLDGTLEVSRNIDDDLEPAAHPHQEYHHELDDESEILAYDPASHYKLGDVDEIDRYDKTFFDEDDDDDDEEWVDIPLG